MPSAIPRRLAALLGRSRASVLQVLLRERRRVFQIHPAVVNRRGAGRRTGVLHEEDRPARRRIHFMLEMRVGHIGDRTGAVELSGKCELALGAMSAGEQPASDCPFIGGAAERRRLLC